MEQLRHNRLLNLSIWFGINALFARTNLVHLLGATLPVPDLGTADWFGLLLAGLSFLAMKYGKFGMITVLAACSGLGFL